MRDAGAEIAAGNKLAFVQSLLGFLNLGFENLIVQCRSGDDFIVCTESQEGGLTDGFVSHFHFQGLSARAIHFDSICNELAPSLTVDHLLNTPTTNDAEWAHVLFAAPTLAAHRFPAPSRAPGGNSSVVVSENDGISLLLAKQTDGVALTWNGTATRLLKSFSPALVAGVCLAVSGQSTVDAGQLTVPASAYYEVGPASLCTPGPSPAVTSMSPASGSAMGGYSITILGTGFDAGTRVRIGDFYASDVVVVNGTTLTCRMVPGHPGEAIVTVINASGQSANASFTYVDPGPIPGGVAITARSGARSAGSSARLGGKHRSVLAVLRRAVVLVELTDAVLEVVELIGQLSDLLLLATHAAGAGNRR
jgi:hypothetical protein